MRGSVLRTRPLPNSDVSPPSPVRVVTRAERLATCGDERFRAGTRESIRATRAMLAAVRNASTRTGGTRMPTGRGDDDRARSAQAQGKRLVTAVFRAHPDGAGVQQAGAVFRFGS